MRYCLWHTMMKCRRRRLFSVVIFLLTASTVFLIVQFFSHNVLQDHNKTVRSHGGKLEQVHIFKEKHGHLIDNDIVQKNKKCSTEDCEEESHFKPRLLNKTFEVLTKTPDIKNKTNVDIIYNDIYKRKDNLENTVKEKHKKFKTFWDELENSSTFRGVHLEVQENLPMVRGVPTRWTVLYFDNENMFTCLNSQEKIPFSHVNDDYCDCLDHSDEPGTSACTNSRFYCRFQLSSGKMKSLSPNLVDDGVCDCCDGSDESPQSLLPDHLQLQDRGMHGSVYQTPCSNHCQALEEEEARLQRVKKEGAEIKLEYIKEGQQHDNPDKIYGVDGAFYRLGQNCYQRAADKYTYNLCPFQKSEQSFGHSPGSDLGKKPHWKQPSDRGHVLVMEGGSRYGCPDAKQRETIVQFECGIKDEILDVTETEVCVYTMRFSTPAAC